VSQDVQISISLDHGELISVLNSPDFVLSADKKALTYHINDLQSEESKNVVFQFEVPKFDSVSQAKPTTVVGKISYFNVITSTTHDILSKSVIIRPGSDVPEHGSTVNKAVENQRMRILTVKAMSSALAIITQNQYNTAEARSVIQTAIDELLIAVTSDPSNSFVAQLVKDLHTCISSLADPQIATHTLSSMAQTHREQRSNRSAEEAGVLVLYGSSRKESLKAKFK
jgi:hypothetical protein